MKGKYIAKGILIGILCIGAFFAFGWITMSLWNWLMPALFGLHVITYCQAFGLLILSRILFGGFHKGWRRGCHGRGRCNGSHGGWKSRWENKWAQMTPEEKEKFKKGFGKKCWPEEESEGA
jgi:hypothetical protein